MSRASPRRASTSCAGSSRCGRVTGSTVQVTVLKAAPSKSKPDRGAVTSFIKVFNQADEAVMSMKVVNIIARRPAA